MFKSDCVCVCVCVYVCACVVPVTFGEADVRTASVSESSFLHCRGLLKVFKLTCMGIMRSDSPHKQTYSRSLQSKSKGFCGPLEKSINSRFCSLLAACVDFIWISGSRQ